MSAERQIMDGFQIWAKVADGNWGAHSVAERLQHRSDWYEMMQWCLKRGYVGESLWILYKDLFHEDLYRMGDYIRWQMRADEPKRNLSRFYEGCPITWE